MTKDLEQEEVYKYLCFGVSNGVQHAAVKEKNKKIVLPESTSNQKDRTRLYKSHRSNKYLGNNVCCNV